MLPKADAIVFEGGDDTLGIATWDAVAKALPGSLRPLPGYPTRYFAADIPEDWHLAQIDLKPWQGPQ